MAQSSSQDLVSGPELAELAQEPYSTIDHWSDMRLLQFTYRGRRRLYQRKASLERCRRIRTLQERGMNLTTIRDLLGPGS